MEITDQEQRAAWPGNALDLCELLAQGQGQCPRVAFGCSCHLSDDREYGMSRSGRSDIPGAVARDHHAAYALPVVQGRPEQQAGGMGGEYGFEAVSGAEMHGRPQVYRNQYRSLPFLMEQLGVGFPGPGGYAPVDGPHIIPRRVLPDLIKLHTATPAMGTFGTRQIRQGAVDLGDIEEAGGEASRYQAAAINDGALGCLL